ncbi:signal transduction histidine kinase [Microbacteriaceae bacterium SG_E_30_P1]|uniref:histidine kinase n=1 Tax=Antiquaquibacter oligotrophicus TaxID=2880260 RepID=A0ABT6KM99_9MICO|nr:histidine kinase [Antiquaquibacter oligotrophicus]MDH6181140.1 signal transduction histidine kinase [Antiquaquibacter oligotrophicus]UDF13163.1 histidine kinase [Antiquaquibacter oligotrophicus]
MIRSLSAPQLAFDIIVATLCVLLRSVLPFDSPAGWIMLLLMGAALAIRRLSPAIALAVAWAGAIIQMSGMLPPDAANLAILAVLFATARYGTPLVRRLGLASAIVGAVIATLYFLATGFTVALSTASAFVDAIPQLVFALVFSLGASLAVLVLSWTVGLLVRTADLARDNRRAAELSAREVAIEQERNRIARDMHDVVAHSLAVVIAQADGARYAAAANPDAAQAALATIATTAREALTDVRGLLAQLRHNQGPAPHPVLADLSALVQQLRDAGLGVDFVERGERPPVATAQQLAIYRIVQEALTNALRHGNATGNVGLQLEWGEAGASIVVRNRLRGGAEVSSTTGHGLTGMQERASLVGGSLHAGPEGDEFVVSAHIPLATAEAVS